MKKVVLVGHCGPDNSYLRMAVMSADKSIQVFSAHDSGELEKAIGRGANLILLNRELDYGFDETAGVDVIRKLRKSHPELKTMLVSNYPDAQAAAVAAGAAPGFGKREIGTPRVAQIIREALQVPAPQTI
jgi:DNA-binding NarL/FixJ family response regulator